MTKNEEIYYLKKQKALLLELIHDLDTINLYEYDYDYDWDDNIIDNYQLFDLGTYLEEQMEEFYNIEEKLKVKNK